ncbi:hypothetical protein LXL04_023863 [Taraxacum kok-saghyz]
MKEKGVLDGFTRRVSPWEQLQEGRDPVVSRRRKEDPVVESKKKRRKEKLTTPILCNSSGITIFIFIFYLLVLE